MVELRLLGIVETTSPICIRSASTHKINLLQFRMKKITKRNWRIKMTDGRYIQRIVVLPALSKPRTRIRASRLPNKLENKRVNTMPIPRRPDSDDIQREMDSENWIGSDRIAIKPSFQASAACYRKHFKMMTSPSSHSIRFNFSDPARRVSRKLGPLCLLDWVSNWAGLIYFFICQKKNRLLRYKNVISFL